MLKLFYALKELDFSQLMEVYQEGNAENAREFYPREEENIGILLAERDFYQYLKESFFPADGAVYAVWIEEGRYVSALRLESYQDGLLLEALETHPDHRRKGYAVKLIGSVRAEMKSRGYHKIYSHVRKGNAASLNSHKACGFQRVLEHAVYIDGSVTQRSCTLCLEL